MTFYADLHIHSKYSRATSRDSDLEHMAYWARKKGVAVIGTGDFTHPKWFAEITEKLVAAEPGLYRLRPEIEQEVAGWLDAPGGEPIRFMLQVEISTIYKKDDKTRKVHHLIYAPDLEKTQRIITSLSRIGNLTSDGRPILGLDSRDLLQITLEAGEGCYLIPAHIWTPWFAVLGSKSGFDTLEHCYGDLTSEIFALETGLSSDPEMNWRLSGLDRFTLVSNSDAHSSPKIGREACAFHTDLDYFAIRRALQTGQGYGGTIEFYPEEGKYHLDGHRKCGVCLTPEQTQNHGGLCPICDQPVTLGVLHRVNELADRDQPMPPPDAAPFRSFVPLEEVLAEIQGVGAKAKGVQRKYEDLIARFGPELFILEDAPLEDIERGDGGLLAEALSRMRSGRVIREAGFDGQYGTIRLFQKDELKLRSSSALLFDLSTDGEKQAFVVDVKSKSNPSPDQPVTFESCPNNNAHEVEPDRATVDNSHPSALKDVLAQLDIDQRAALDVLEGPLLIIAGPGTGKTRTLTHRLAYLIADHQVAPENCLAITFTRRAAHEMGERLETLVSGRASQIPVMTFHALGMSILQEQAARFGFAQTPRIASDRERVKLLQDLFAWSERKATHWLKRISRHKGDGYAAVQSTAPGVSLDSDLIEVSNVYTQEMQSRGLIDFDDLIGWPLQLLIANPELIEFYRSRYRWISIDEFQDMDAVQYRLIKSLVPPDGNLCVIGDPDQAIYRFRGADVRCFQQFRADFPSAQTVVLKRNYRSTQPIVDASLQLIAPASALDERTLEAEVEGLDLVEIHECATERAEAEFVVHTIERFIGGSTFFSMDSGRVQSHEGEALSFADFAVLYRTQSQGEPLVEALARSGMPFQKRSHGPLSDQPAVQTILNALIGSADRTGGHCSVVEQLEQMSNPSAAADSELILHLPVLRSLAERCGNDARRFADQLALGLDLDQWDPRADRISLLTLHAAKGLEFPVVFIVGCEDGLMPLSWGPSDELDLAEERRLFFVGMTRAKRRLLLTHARKRLWRGRIEASRVSPFLHDIPQKLLSRHAHRAVCKSSASQKQLTFFD